MGQLGQVIGAEPRTLDVVEHLMEVVGTTEGSIKGLGVRKMGWLTQVWLPVGEGTTIRIVEN